MDARLCHFCVEFWHENCEFCANAGCERCEPQEATRIARIDQEACVELCDRHARAFEVAFVRTQMEEAAEPAVERRVH